MDWLTQSGPKSLSDVRCVVKDGQGTVWFGMLGGGLGRVDRAGLRLLHKADGFEQRFLSNFCTRTTTAAYGLERLAAV